MSLLWAVPTIAAVIGVAVMLVGLRAVDLAAADMRTQLQRLGEVRLAVAELRDEGAAARAKVRELRRN
jgi:hypothetical protein